MLQLIVLPQWFAIVQLKADDKIPEWVIATFNTDYILVEDAKLEMAKKALCSAGFAVA